MTDLTNDALNIRCAERAKCRSEAELCPPILAKLRAEGWEPKCEVLDIDVVAMKYGQILACEAKLTFNTKLTQQLAGALYRADFVIAAVGREPHKRRIGWCQLHGVGLWVIPESGPIVELVRPAFRDSEGWAKERLIQRFKRAASDATGGHPCGPNKRPAQETQQRVTEYLAAHPGASWRDIFAKVPNHYASPQSMKQSLQKLALAFIAKEEGKHLDSTRR